LEITERAYVLGKISKEKNLSLCERGQIAPKCRSQIIHNWSVVVINQSRRMSYVSE